LFFGVVALPYYVAKVLVARRQGLNRLIIDNRLHCKQRP